MNLANKDNKNYFQVFLLINLDKGDDQSVSVRYNSNLNILRMDKAKEGQIYQSWRSFRTEISKVNCDLIYRRLYANKNDDFYDGV